MTNKIIVVTFEMDSGNKWSLTSSDSSKDVVVEKIKELMSHPDGSPLVFNQDGETVVIPRNKVSIVHVKEQ